MRTRLAILGVFVLMQVYLIGLKKHDTLFLDVYPNDTPSPRIYGPMSAGQTFLAKINGLARIDLMIGTYQKTIQKDLVFRLWETKPASALVVETTIRGAELKDNLYQPITFKPIRNSKGREYKFAVSAAEAVFDDSISLWMNRLNIYPAGRALINDAPAKGEMIFRAYARRAIIAELGRIVAKYPGFLGSKVLFGTVIVLFEIVQVYFLWWLLGYLFGSVKTPALAANAKKEASADA